MVCDDRKVLASLNNNLVSLLPPPIKTLCIFTKNEILDKYKSSVENFTKLLWEPVAGEFLTSNDLSHDVYFNITSVVEEIHCTKLWKFQERFIGDETGSSYHFKALEQDRKTVEENVDEEVSKKGGINFNMKRKRRNTLSVENLRQFTMLMTNDPGADENRLVFPPFFRFSLKYIFIYVIFSINSLTKFAEGKSQSLAVEKVTKLPILKADKVKKRLLF